MIRWYHQLNEQVFEQAQGDGEEQMLLNFGVGEDSWESLGLQGDPASPF